MKVSKGALVQHAQEVSTRAPVIANDNITIVDIKNKIIQLEMT